MQLMINNWGMMIEQAIGTPAVAAHFNSRGCPFSHGTYDLVVIANGGNPAPPPASGFNGDRGDRGERITTTTFLPDDATASIVTQPHYSGATSMAGYNVSIGDVVAEGGAGGNNSSISNPPAAGYSYSPAGSLIDGTASGALESQIGEGGSGVWANFTTGKSGVIKFMRVG